MCLSEGKNMVWPFVQGFKQFLDIMSSYQNQYKPQVEFKKLCKMYFKWLKVIFSAKGTCGVTWVISQAASHDTKMN